MAELAGNMSIIVYCIRCSDDSVKYDDVQMYTIGPLTVSPDLTQAQEYKCPTCEIVIQVVIQGEVKP